MLVAVYPQRPSEAVTAALLQAAYRPVPVADVADVAEREPEGGWAAVVVDLTAAPAAGMVVARRIRDQHDHAVLVVADRSQVEQVAAGEGYGDFILTPIDTEELRLRLARLGPETSADADEVVRFKDLELNLATYQATLGREPVDLTYMEYELLRFFLTNPAKAWSRDQILSKVWGYDYFGGSRTVDVHVRRLRAKLGEERASWITTVRSVGYRFG